MKEMSIKMSEIQRDLISLKSAKVKYYHEETPKLEEVESDKDEKQDKIVLEMKQEITKKKKIIKTINDKCENLEAKLTDESKEYKTLTDVAGKMFNEIKQYRDPTSKVKAHKDKETHNNLNLATSSQNNSSKK